MIEEFKSLNFFKHANVDFYHKSPELILSYYIPIELKKVPSLINCLTDYDTLQAYLFKRKFLKQDFSVNMDSNHLRELFDIDSISESLFYYTQPENTCPMVDESIDEMKSEYNDKIEALNDEIENLKTQIEELNTEAEEALENAEDQEEIDQINSSLESSIDDLSDDIYRLENEIDDYEDEIQEKEDELESLRTSCETTRKEGELNRSNFYQYINNLIIDQGEITSPSHYLDEIKEEKYQESRQYNESQYPEAYRNLELIEAWASQWTESQCLDSIFEDLNYVVKEEQIIKKHSFISTVLNQTQQSFKNIIINKKGWIQKREIS